LQPPRHLDSRAVFRADVGGVQLVRRREGGRAIRMKLANKFALATVLGIAIVLAVTTFLHSQREIARWEASDRLEQQRIAALTASVISRVWEQNGDVSARAALGAARDATGARVRWVWLDEGAPADSRPRVAPAALDLTEPNQVVHVLGPEGQLTYTYRSVEAPDGRLGAVEVAVVPGERGAMIRALVFQGVGLTLLIALVAGVVAAAFGRRFVGRPIEELAAVARRVGQGDFSQRVHVRQVDELGDLGRELNAMCETLEVVEHRRETAREQLRYADRLSTVGQIASSIAHEVGTPLNIVSGRASMMASGLVKPEDVPKNAHIIVEQTKRMAGIIRQLLDFARRGGGVRQDVHVEELVLEVFQLLKPSARKHNVELEVVDPPRGETSIRGDAAQLQQVLANIIVNALEAMPEGGRVEVSFDVLDATAPADYDGHSGTFLQITLCDEGRGIPESDRKRIFDAFYTTKRPGEGTGLGLAVADQIVRAHRGWIAIESTVGEGTCVKVYLPHGESS
jgi:two-component system, NtrC family, sensor kinase